MRVNSTLYTARLQSILLRIFGKKIDKWIRHFSTSTGFFITENIPGKRLSGV
jgi:hypothetical protein